LTYLLLAAFGEQITIRNSDAISAATVCSVSECPAEKSLRSQKDRPQALGHVASSGWATDQIPVDPKSLKPRVQLSRPRPVVVAVAQEGPVFDRNCIRHAVPSREQPNRTAAGT